MTDHFAALKLPRRPWLEADALKEGFHRLSATLHPDVPGTGDAARIAAVNAAYAVLRDPSARARHLLELETPALGTQALPPSDFGDLFMRLGGLHQRLAAFLTRRRAAGTALARALLATDEAALRQDAEATRAALDAACAQAVDDLRALDDAWLPGDRACVERLAAIHQRLSFLSKWLTQLREAMFQLGA